MQHESGYTLVDCDVHPILRGGLDDLYPYLSAAGRRRLGIGEPARRRRAVSREPVSLPRNQMYINPAGCCAATRLRRTVPPRHRPGVRRASTCSTRTASTARC